MLTDRQDAFGHEINDYYINKSGFEIVERNDGFFTAGIGPSLYFLEHHDWLESEKEAIKYAKGSVLDIGCGAGRHSLYLRNKVLTFWVLTFHRLPWRFAGRGVLKKPGHYPSRR